MELSVSVHESMTMDIRDKRCNYRSNDDFSTSAPIVSFKIDSEDVPTSQRPMCQESVQGLLGKSCLDIMLCEARRDANSSVFGRCSH
jgi:hypothetical protein